MTFKRPILVGISGASSSGKTTLAKLITNLLPENSVTLIHEDDFFKHDDQVPIDEKYGIANWDSPDALDLPLFINELQQIKERGVSAIASNLIHNGNVDSLDKFNFDPVFVEEMKSKFVKLIPENCKIVLVDGFMMFHDDALRSLFDVRLLVRAPYDVIKRRRAARPGYQTLDSFWVDPPYYFDEFVYKSYKEAHSYLFIDNNVENKEGVKSEYDIKLFDNTDDIQIEQGLQWIYKELEDYISTEVLQ